MNHFSFALISALVFINSISFEAQAQPVKVPAYFQKMYIPGGFDSNDQIQIVGEGTFSNSCCASIVDPCGTINIESAKSMFP